MHCSAYPCPPHMSSQFTVFLSTLAYAEQKLAKALRALLHAAAKVMKSAHSNRTFLAIVGNEIELGFISKGDLLFKSFHARIYLFFLLLAKFTNYHPGNSLLVAGL